MIQDKPFVIWRAICPEPRFAEILKEDKLYLIDAPNQIAGLAKKIKFDSAVVSALVSNVDLTKKKVLVVGRTCYNDYAHLGIDIVTSEENTDSKIIHIIKYFAPFTLKLDPTCYLPFREFLFLELPIEMNIKDKVFTKSLESEPHLKEFFNINDQENSEFLKKFTEFEIRVRGTLLTKPYEFVRA